MYDHTKQYRCTIIRGKSQKEMDDLLPAYAKVIDSICPCLANVFEEKFNELFAKYLPNSQHTKKTLDNHRTEISGKLFGMYYLSEDNIIYESERTQKFLADNDQPAFFKDICYKMQFPNGTQKINTLKNRIENNISIRPYAFLLKLLLIAESSKISISKRDIGYYVLNSLDVLQGKATPYEVLAVISDDKSKNIIRTIRIPGKQSSYTWQHINEQINYLELANLIFVTEDKYVILNKNEKNTIQLFAKDWNKKPEFDVYSYKLDTIEERKHFQYSWDYYFSKLSSISEQFATSITSLIHTPNNITPQKTSHSPNLIELGDNGEQIVFEYEKKRVAKFNQRLSNKVLSLGKTRGLGYDIQSVIAEPGEQAEFVKYIEVKSTKRVTKPNVEDHFWIDTLNITRNEWIAAKQHQEFYSIFRVYFTRNGISIFIINNPAKKAANNLLQIIPTTYRIDFNNSSVDKVILDLDKETI